MTLRARKSIAARYLTSCRKYSWQFDNSDSTIQKHAVSHQMITFILEMIIRFLLSSANILFDSGVEAGVRQVDFKVYVLGLTWGGTCTQPAYVEVMRTCDYT